MKFKKFDIISVEKWTGYIFKARINWIRDNEMGVTNIENSGSSILGLKPPKNRLSHTNYYRDKKSSVPAYIIKLVERSK